ncbi:proheparin-binding EGF-like growth factor [Carassius carassius]|uniref:proheparin-binding EGF-like growth factor n=1 Tax=Carassius carassius TaxID=217509 RepID=UPI002868F770|nr:proheparin-binding EGF-like growth factor [Carassius carassius]
MIRRNNNLGMSRLVCSGASVDRYESAKHRTTMVILFHTLEKTNTAGHQVDRGTNLCGKYDDDEDYDLSVDYDSNQPRGNLSAIPTTEKKMTNGKGEGRKNKPCSEIHKDFCLNGVCHYSEELDSPVCSLAGASYRCQVGYSGERCHLLMLVSKKEPRYSEITPLAVIAVVLSLTCLTVIAILLALRYHKKDDADVESAEVIGEEKKEEPKRTDGTEEKQGHNC